MKDSFYDELEVEILIEYYKKKRRKQLFKQLDEDFDSYYIPFLEKQQRHQEKGRAMLASGVKPDKDYLIESKYNSNMEVLLDNIRKMNNSKWATSVRFGLLTVNPPDMSVDKIPDLLKCISKFITKKWLKGMVIYTIEQRGDTPDTRGNGIHFHCSFQLPFGKSKSHILRETFNTFKVLLTNQSSIDLQTNSVRTHFDSYVKGENDDKIRDDGCKRQKCIQDNIMRKELGLKPYYEINI